VNGVRSAGCQLARAHGGDRRLGPAAAQQTDGDDGDDQSADEGAHDRVLSAEEAGSESDRDTG
jgi:hypothetical protein